MKMTLKHNGNFSVYLGGVEVWGGEVMPFLALISSMAHIPVAKDIPEKKSTFIFQSFT